MTASIVDPMAAFYAAVTAVENGKVAEVELEYRNVAGEVETILTMSVRREVRHFALPPPAGGEA